MEKLGNDDGCGGIDLKEYMAWLLSGEKVEISPRMRVEKSELGGLGLFYRNDGGLEDLVNLEDFGDDIVVARIPDSASYDYIKLLQLLTSLKEEEQDQGWCEYLPPAIISIALKAMEPKNETDILCGYFVGFSVCKRLEGGKNGPESRLLKSVLPYLKILCHTFVTGPPGDEYYHDEFINLLVQKCSILKEKYEYMMQELARAGIATETLEFKFEDYLQIVNAIRSRALEIPCASGDDDDDANDFYTNVTLVPFLDFANHKSVIQSNAFFDVDRQTKDILVRLKILQLKPGDNEVTISYSPTESVQHFVLTYGFIPSLQDVQLLEVRVPSAVLNECMNQTMGTQGIPYDRILKWLRILPLFQLVKTTNDVFVNFFNCNLPLAFVPGLTYNNDWRLDACSAFNRENDAKIEQHEFDQEILPILEQQEKSYDCINGIPQVGVVYKATFPLVQSLSQDLQNDDDDVFDQLLLKCTSCIILMAKSLVSQLRLPRQSPTTNNSSFHRLARAYKDTVVLFLLSLVEKHEATGSSDLALPLEAANPAWELEYRSKLNALDVS